MKEYGLKVGDVILSYDDDDDDNDNSLRDY